MVLSFEGFASEDWLLIMVPPILHVSASLLVSLTACLLLHDDYTYALCGLLRTGFDWYCYFLTV